MNARIVEILKMSPPIEISVSGWVRSFRGSRFIALNDGSCMASLQIVIDAENFSEEIVSNISNSASISVKGKLVPSQGGGQEVELQAEEITILGKSDQQEVQKTILQPKKHSLEKLREQGHLRMRTNLFGAVFRIRHHMAFAIHKYFNDNGYFYIHTPIITGTDAEGAGETFRVTTLPLGKKEVDVSQDFFGKPTHLTVSGQLEAELAALALGKVYTFGPTFRAENSNTTRHLAEFWMIEPEIAFADIKDDIDLGEDFLKYLINYALATCKEELQFLNDRDDFLANRYKIDKNQLVKEDDDTVYTLDDLEYPIFFTFHQLMNHVHSSYELRFHGKTKKELLDMFEIALNTLNEYYIETDNSNILDNKQNILSVETEKSDSENTNNSIEKIEGNDNSQSEIKKTIKIDQE